MKVLIYGATGHAGRLVAEQARARGVPVHLAGRDPARVEAVARELDLPWSACPLDDAPALRRLVAACTAVLHCAGPFGRTWAPMVEACLATGRPYLDVNGELAVFEGIGAVDRRARDRGVPVLPGCGQDVVPLEALTGALQRRLPTGTHLSVAVWTASSAPSRGSLRTILHTMPRGGAELRGGRLVRVPLGTPRWRQPFPDGPRVVTGLPLAELAMARWLGLPHARAGVAAAPVDALALRLLLPTLRGPVGALARRLADRAVPVAPPPTHGEVSATLRDTEGRAVALAARLPDPYRLTAALAVEAALRAHQPGVPGGVHPPGRALGADLLTSVPGVTLVEVDPPEARPVAAQHR